MARSLCYLIVFPLTCFVLGSWAQRSPYSLQTAVDELHHWDAAKFPLNAPPSQPNYYRSALGSATDQDYWDDDNHSKFPYKTNSYRNRHRLRKELAKYLERENNNKNNEQGGLSLGLGPFDDFFDKSNNLWSKQVDQKRGLSYFRQQVKSYDNAPSSVFRERDSQASNGNSELTEEFLREIEEAQEREREQRYKNALRHLLENYQQQDNDVDNKLFDEQKRMRVPPYYMLMQKKRSYPVLPWLPYSERKKRFPVTKRSTKRSSIDNGNLDKTDERVEKELSELFGISNSDAKKKRSTDDQTKTTTTSPATVIPTAMNDMRLELPTKSDTNDTEAATNITPAQKKEHAHTTHNHAAHDNHGHQHEHKHNKRSNHHSGEDEHNDSEEEEEEDSEEHGEHGDEHEDEEDDEDFGDEEDEERKKKRDVSAVKKSSPDDMMKRRKKSIQWSKYFGIDRKKKALQMDKKFIKRSASQDSNERDEDKRNLSSDKLNNMDRKLQSIEDMIIDETIKYTGAHEGITNPTEIRRLKDHVLSRLATAYSLEKMRLALDKLRQSVDNENHLLRNTIESESGADDDNESYEFPNHLMSKKEKSDIPYVLL